MKVLTAPLWELAEFEEGKALLDRGKGHVAFPDCMIPRSFIWYMD